MLPIHPKRTGLPRWLVASRRTQFFLAALCWTAGGTVLTATGLTGLMRTDGIASVLLLLVVALAGVLKARFALRPFVARSVKRICLQGDGRFAGSFFSPGSWLLIAGMILMARSLDLLGLPHTLRASIQSAIGIGLLATSAPFWLSALRPRADQSRNTLGR